MKNTGIVYDSVEQTPAISPAFANLLPPLSDEQYTDLEVDILHNGCYSPIIVNEDCVIVDGHHRHEICEKHGVPYKMAVFTFEDDLEARQWALITQKARRNLSTWELGQIALKLKPDIEARAKENMSAGGGDKVSEAARAGFQTSENPLIDEVNTTKELADIAGTSHDTMNKIIQLDESAPEPIKEALNDGEITINAGYNITRLLEKLPEETREAAMERAIDLAKQRKSYKAVFDISLDDMNALVRGNDGAADTIRQALYSGELSVNGGKEVAGVFLDMPEGEREAASADPEGLAKLEDEYRRGLEFADDHGRIAKAYCAAFEKAVPIKATEYEVRAWVEFAGIRKDEISGLIDEAECAADRFSQIAGILKNIYEQEVAPYEYLLENSAGQGES